MILYITLSHLMSFLYNQLLCQIPTPDCGARTKFLLFGQKGIIPHLQEGRYLHWRSLTNCIYRAVVHTFWTKHLAIYSYWIMQNSVTRIKYLFDLQHVLSSLVRLLTLHFHNNNYVNMTRLSTAIAKVGKVAGLQGVCKKTLPRFKTSKPKHREMFSSFPTKRVYFIV